MRGTIFRANPNFSLFTFPFSIPSTPVGYETISLNPGKQEMKGAQFVKVGGEPLSIQDIKMDENVYDSGCILWWYNQETGTYDANAFWFTCLYDEQGQELNVAGWGDEELWAPIEKTFAPGESFWIQPDGGLESATYTMAGQVEVTDVSDEYYAIPLVPGKQAQFTNPFPTGALNIQDIKMSENVYDSGCILWWYNQTTGTYDANAFWFTCLYDEQGAELNIPGWGDEELWAPIQKTFDAGTGFWIQPDGGLESANVMFKNPFYKAPAK